MQYYYADNYRGFSDTLIPFKDVNFLVGENSTGKTSILALINLLNSPLFWFSQSFSLDEYRFGNFNDIVSAGNRSKPFRIGYIEFDEKNDSKISYLFSCKDDQGVPKINKCIIRINEQEIRVHWGKKKTYYKTSTGGIPINENDFLKETLISWRQENNDSIKGYKSIPHGKLFSGRGSLFFLQSYFLNEEKKRIHVPISNKELVWLAPIRTKPQRTYDEYLIKYSPEGGHTPYLIKKIFNSNERKKNFKKYLDEFGKDSGMFETVYIKNYGKGATSPFELDIKMSEKYLSVDSVGYGVSQCLPVVVELYDRPIGATFAIQQPEVHLHPKAQAAIGEIIYLLAEIQDKKFLVETHSDYLIDRYKILHKKSSSQRPSAQILFFERTNEGNRVYPMSINENGELPENQPKSYRDFFLKEEFAILGL